jgi:hypothetical protein
MSDLKSVIGVTFASPKSLPMLIGMCVGSCRYYPSFDVPVYVTAKPPGHRRFQRAGRP